MSKLPDDFSTAYDYVKGTLGAATSICVHILNEERAKKLPDQLVIDKYKQIWGKTSSDLKRELLVCDRQRMQEIHDEYILFVRSHRSL